MRALVATLIACALLAAGCGTKPEPTGTVVQQTFPIEVRDGLNRIVTVSALPNVIVRLKNGPRKLFGKRWLGVPTQLAAANAGSAALKTLQADIVITGPAITTVDSSRYARIAKELGKPVFVMPGSDLASIEIAVVRIGQVTGRPEQGRTLALRLRAIRTGVEKRLIGVQPRTVFVDRGLGASLPRSTFFARLIEQAGGKLVGPADGSALTPQQLLKLNPDVYIGTLSGGLTLQQLRRQPILSKLTSVQDGRVARIDPSRATADVGAFGLLRELAGILHPEAFK